MNRIQHFFQKRPLAAVIMVAVAVLAPLMYSLSFIKSVWDPYGGAKDLPVAVVNNDRPTEYHGQTLRVGDDTVSQLKHNHQLKWQFVSASTAKVGMANHRYYTVVTIPKDFSRDAATVMDKHPHKMELKYQTNDSKNYLAETMSEIGMGRLNSQIRSSVTNAYANAVFQNLKVLDKGMNQAATGANQLTSGLATLQDGTNRYTIGVSQVNNGVQTLKIGVTPLTAVARQLASGSQTLATGISTFTGGVGQLGSGLATLTANSAQLNGGAIQLNSGLTTLSQNSQNLRNGSQQLQDGAQTLDATVRPAMDSLNLNGVMGALDQADQLKAGLAQLQSGLATANSTLTTISGTANQLSGTVGKLGAASSQLGKLSGVANNDKNIATSDAAIAAQASALAKSTTDNNAKSQLAAIAQNAANNATTAKGNAEAIAGMTGTLNDIQSLQGQLTAMQGQLASLSSMRAVLNNASSTMTMANHLLNSLDGYRGTLANAAGMPARLEGAIHQLSTGATTLNGGLAQYSTGVDQAAAGAHRLNNGIGQYTAGVAQANAGASQLTSNSGQLNAGAGQLAGALGQLNNQVPSLVNGFNQLANGTQQLVANSPALLGGIGLLSSGANRLGFALADGAHQLNQQQPSAKAAKMFGAPTMLKHNRYSRVPNYGHALAPFIMGTGLFIGVLIFTLEFPSSDILADDQDRLAMVLHELFIAVIASLLMVLVQNLGLMATGLHVQHSFQLYLVGIAYTLAQMAIMQFFTIILGRFGTIIGLLLFVAQLGGAGGMFPMEVTNRFFNVIHPWLPMTYAINGFRQAITGGFNASYINSNVMVLAGFAIVFYAAMFMIANPLKLRFQRAHAPLEAE